MGELCSVIDTGTVVLVVGGWDDGCAVCIVSLGFDALTSLRVVARSDEMVVLQCDNVRVHFHLTTHQPLNEAHHVPDGFRIARVRRCDRVHYKSVSEVCVRQLGLSGELE